MCGVLCVVCVCVCVWCYLHSCSLCQTLAAGLPILKAAYVDDVVASRAAGKPAPNKADYDVSRDVPADSASSTTSTTTTATTAATSKAGTKRKERDDSPSASSATTTTTTSATASAAAGKKSKSIAADYRPLVKVGTGACGSKRRGIERASAKLAHARARACIWQRKCSRAR